MPLLQLKLISFSICFAFARIQQLLNRPNNSFSFSFDLVGLKTTGDFKCIILECITKCMLKNVLADALCFCHPFLLTHEIEGASYTSSPSTPQPQSSQWTASQKSSLKTIARSINRTNYSHRVPEQRGSCVCAGNRRYEPLLILMSKCKRQVRTPEQKGQPFPVWMTQPTDSTYRQLPRYPGGESLRVEVFSIATPLPPWI